MRSPALLLSTTFVAFFSLTAIARAQQPGTTSDQGAGSVTPPVAAPPSATQAPTPDPETQQRANGAPLPDRPPTATAPANLPPEDTAPPPLSQLDSTGSIGARGVGLAPPGYRAGDFMDTRLTWTFGDDDFLHRTGELLPISPNFSVGDRAQYRLFFDSLNSRFAGRENLTHLVMYKKMPGFIKNLTTEAAVVLRFDMAALAANTGNLNAAIYDSGSYIRLFYQTGAKANQGISAVFFPLDTDRFRLGYLYDISWGGTAASINQSIFPRIQGSSPGMKIQYDTDHAYLFAGFKTATIVEPLQVLNAGGDNDVEVTNVGQTNYGALAGGGVDISDNFRADLGAGYFQQGRFNLDDVRGRPVYTYGGSARVVAHKDMPVPQSVDFLLYRNDPNAPMTLFRPENYHPGQVAFSVSAEADILGQHLKDFDTAGATKDQAAYAAAIQGVVKAGYARFSITGITRNLSYVVRNVPGFIPFETLPKGAETSPELFGAVAADYYFPDLHLTPGIGGGVQLPSTFKSEFTDGGVQASRTLVVRSQGDESILPYDGGRSAIVQARVSVRWDISRILAANAFMQLVHDNNGTLVIQDPTQGTSSLRVFQSPNRLGAGLSLQARF